MVKLYEANELSSAREQEAGLACLRYLIEWERSRLERERAEEGVVVFVFRRTDALLPMLEKAAEVKRNYSLNRGKASKSAERYGAVHKGRRTAKPE